MNGFFIRILLLLISLGAQSPAWAGNGTERGGGVAFVCADGIYLADTYPLFMRKDVRPFPDEMIEDLKIGDTTLKLLDRDFPGVRKKMKRAQEDLEWISATSEIPLLGDDFIRKIPKQCKNGRKAQIAVQTLDSGQIEYDPILFHQLSKAEQLLLEFHERLVRVAHQGFLPRLSTEKGTAPVRRILLSHFIKALVTRIRGSLMMRLFGGSNSAEMAQLLGSWAVWSIYLDSSQAEASAWPSLWNQSIIDPTSGIFLWAKKKLAADFGTKMSDNAFIGLLKRSREAFDESARNWESVSVHEREEK